MRQENSVSSLETLHEIRNIMERSVRFLSLSGWSGIWAGFTAIAGAYAAYKWLMPEIRQSITQESETFCFCGAHFYKPIILAAIIFIIALAGACYFTVRKVQKQGGTLWNAASRAMARAMALPLAAGAVFCFGFMKYGHAVYLAPACLIFYGLALYNGSKYTLSEIRYLGLLEVILGCMCLFLPGYGLYFWAAGFGLLHILYGIIMWNKYDKKTN